MIRATHKCLRVALCLLTALSISPSGLACAVYGAAAFGSSSAPSSVDPSQPPQAAGDAEELPAHVQKEVEKRAAAARKNAAKQKDGDGKPQENPPVPEPGTLAIVGGGLLAVSLLRRRNSEGEAEDEGEESEGEEGSS